MQDEDESQTKGISTEINLDVIEEVLGDEVVLTEEDDIIVTTSFNDDDDEIDIAFHANDEKYW